MDFSLKYGIFGLILSISFLFLGCNQSIQKAEEHQGTLIENVDRGLLKHSIQRNLAMINDSGILQDRTLNYPDTLRAIFKNVNNISAWFLLALKPDNILKPADLIRVAENHALDPSFYHSDYIQISTSRMVNKAWDSMKTIPYDSIALYLIYSADALISLYHDLNTGRADPDYSGSIDALPRRHCGKLSALLPSDTCFSAVERSFPDWMEYKVLQNEYIRLHAFRISDLGKQLNFAVPLKPGDEPGKFSLIALCKKLRLHGVLNLHDSDILKKTKYDEQIWEGVAIFQERNNLDPTGILDKNTRDLLNVTHSEMIRKLTANLERWRWMGPVHEKSRIWVNLAENKVYAWREDTLKVEMKVCTGKNRDDEFYRKLINSLDNKDILPPDNLETPLMKAKLAYVVANPTWHVPRNIMIKELLPHLKESPSYLVDHNYILYNWKGEELDPFSINWNKIAPDNWKFRIEQGPGPENALGEVVIQFPNPYSIFMHDTPSKWAFKLENRHVSHGCIRMEYPMQMVEFICSFSNPDNYDDILIALGKEPVRDEKRIIKYQEIMKDSIKSRKLKPKPNAYYKVAVQIPVYIVYFTASQNNNGAIVYHPDGYDRDSKLLKVQNRKRWEPAEPEIPVLKEQQVFSP